MSVCDDERASTYPSSCKRLRLSDDDEEDENNLTTATAAVTTASSTTTIITTPSANNNNKHDNVDDQFEDEFDDEPHDGEDDDEDDDEEEEDDDEEDDEDDDDDDEDDDEDGDDEDDDDEDDDEDDDCDDEDEVMNENNNGTAHEHVKIDVRRQYQHANQSHIATQSQNVPQQQQQHQQQQQTANHVHINPNQMHQTHQETRDHRFINSKLNGQSNTSQHNNNWVLFHTSISKLRRSQSGPEPNLLRSVLICNLLRRLEREMDEGGIKINYGPDGVPTIVNSNQEIMIEQAPQTPAPPAPSPLPTEVAAATIAAAPQQQIIDVITDHCDLDPAIAASVTSTPPVSQIVPIENDCVKHFLDLDLLSSGRITPFPATNKCSMEPCDSEQFSSESSRQSNLSPPRSPTSSSENDCSSHETSSCEHDFSMTTLTSDGNNSIDSPSLDNPDQSPLGQPSYLSLDSGFEELSSRYNHVNWGLINYDAC